MNDLAYIDAFSHKKMVSVFATVTVRIFIKPPFSLCILRFLFILPYRNKLKKLMDSKNFHQGTHPYLFPLCFLSVY